MDGLIVNGHGSVWCPGHKYLESVSDPGIQAVLEGSNLTEKGYVSPILYLQIRDLYMSIAASNQTSTTSKATGATGTSPRSPALLYGTAPSPPAKHQPSPSTPRKTAGQVLTSSTLHRKKESQSPWTIIRCGFTKLTANSLNPARSR